jgi:hypothetical protein
MSVYQVEVFYFHPFAGWFNRTWWMTNTKALSGMWPTSDLRQKQGVFCQLDKHG